MRSAILAVAGFVATAFAAPAYTCMTDDQANKVANNFGSLISAYTNASADTYLCSNFHDYSDSVIELINSGCKNSIQTLGEPTFSSREAFEKGQGLQPNITFNLLNVWHNCDTVTLRWRTPNPGFINDQQFVTGLIVLETVYAGATAPEPYLIETVYSEFNSGAWLVDLAVFTPTNCSAAPASTSAAAARRRSLPRML